MTHKQAQMLRGLADRLDELEDQVARLQAFLVRDNEDWTPPEGALNDSLENVIRSTVERGFFWSATVELRSNKAD